MPNVPGRKKTCATEAHIDARGRTKMRPKGAIDDRTLVFGFTLTGLDPFDQLGREDLPTPVGDTNEHDGFHPLDGQTQSCTRGAGIDSRQPLSVVALFREESFR